MGTLAVGESAKVGDLELTLTRLDGSDGNLEVRRTG